jgi:hypothetical protein
LGEVQFVHMPESSLHWKWSAPTPPELLKANVALRWALFLLTAVMVVLGGGMILVNVAVTLLSGFMVTLQVPVPVQAPDQPANWDPLTALAVSVTGVPAWKEY